MCVRVMRIFYETQALLTPLLVYMDLVYIEVLQARPATCKIQLRIYLWLDRVRFNSLVLALSLVTPQFLLTQGRGSVLLSYFDDFGKDYFQQVDFFF